MCTCNNRYLDASGVSITSDGYPSSAMMTWQGVDGLEELHIFASVAWFDTPSWAWVHHIVEWATKGVFQVMIHWVLVLCAIVVRCMSGNSRVTMSTPAQLQCYGELDHGKDTI